MKNLYFLFLFIFICESLTSQESWCISTAPQRKENFHRFLELDRSNLNTRNTPIDTILINVFLSTDNIGQKSTNLFAVTTAIEKANKVYLEAGIHFKQCGEPTIMMEESFDELNFSDLVKMHNQYGIENTINLYVPTTFYVELSNGIQNNICGLASFPSDDRKSRMVIVGADCLLQPNVLSHELGHFYGLYHTHEKSHGKELVRRKYCYTSGDLLCDTPADPLLTNFNQENCSYTGQRVDQEGQEYQPQLENIMSYSEARCKTSFTNEQLLKIQDTHTHENAYLHKGCSLPDFSIISDLQLDEIQTGTVINLPYTIENIGQDFNSTTSIDIYFASIDFKKIGLVNNIEISLDPHSKRYEVQLNITFANIISEENQILVLEVDPNNQILESNKNNNKHFIPFSMVNGPGKLDFVFPNPAHKTLNVNVNSIDEKGSVILKIFNASGKLVLSQNHDKIFINFQSKIDIHTLPNGIYQCLFILEGKPLQSFRFFVSK